MANVIEAFFISLGMDTSEYEKKQKGVETSLKKMGAVSDKQTKLIAESGKKAASAFSALKIEVLGALAAFGMGAGFKSFIQDSMHSQAALVLNAKALGMTTQRLQAYKTAAHGFNSQAGQSTLSTIAQGLTNAKTGNTSFIRAGAKYGFMLDPSSTTESAFNQIADKAYELKKKFGEQMAISFLGGEGITDSGMQFEMMQSHAQRQQDMALDMQASSGFSQQGGEEALRLQKQWARFATQMEGIRNQIFNKLEPVLEKLGKKLADWLNHIDWNKVIAAIGAFIDKVQSVVKEMGGWKTVAEILGGVLALKILAPILTLTGTLARLLPMFVGATTGVSGLAAAFGTLGVALAGVAGYWLGSELWTHVLAGTKAGDAVSSFAAHVAAMAGDKDAQDAINQMNGNGPKTPGYYHPERTGWYKGKESQAVQYFQSQGFSRNAAIGMAANIARESTFNQKAVGDHGQAYGIGQWHKDRQANFAKVMGLPIQGSSYQQQLAFYAYEVKHNKRLMDILARDPTAAASAMMVSRFDERPANMEGEMIARAKLAQAYVNAHVGAAPQVAGAKSSTTTNDVRIGTIAIHTQADNAYDIFKGARKAIQAHPLIAGSVTAAA